MNYQIPPLRRAVLAAGPSFPEDRPKVCRGAYDAIREPDAQDRVMPRPGKPKAITRMSDWFCVADRGRSKRPVTTSTLTLQPRSRDGSSLSIALGMSAVAAVDLHEGGNPRSMGARATHALGCARPVRADRDLTGAPRLASGTATSSSTKSETTSARRTDQHAERAVAARDRPNAIAGGAALPPRPARRVGRAEKSGGVPRCEGARAGSRSRRVRCRSPAISEAGRSLHGCDGAEL